MVSLGNLTGVVALAWEFGASGYITRTRMSQTDRQNCKIAIGNTHLAVRAVTCKIVI